MGRDSDWYMLNLGQVQIEICRAQVKQIFLPCLSQVLDLQRTLIWSSLSEILWSPPPNPSIGQVLALPLQLIARKKLLGIKIAFGRKNNLYLSCIKFNNLFILEKCFYSNLKDYLLGKTGMLHSDFSVYTGKNYKIDNMNTWETKNKCSLSEIVISKHIKAVFWNVYKNHSRHQNCKYVKFTTNIHSAQVSQWHSFKCRITSR